MNDEQIEQRGGTERDIEEYAKQNGANLDRRDFEKRKRVHSGNGRVRACAVEGCVNPRAHGTKRCYDHVRGYNTDKGVMSNATS